jgi:tetratricopeptide (TPR) repeat protein
MINMQVDDQWKEKLILQIESISELSELLTLVENNLLVSKNYENHKILPVLSMAVEKGFKINDNFDFSKYVDIILNLLEIDSDLSNNKITEEEKITAYLICAETLYSRNPAKGLEICDQMMTMFGHQFSPDHQSKYLFILSKIYWEIGELDKSLEYSQNYLDNVKDDSSWEFLRAKLNFANIMVYKGNIKDGLDCYLEVEKQLKNINVGISGLIYIYGNLGAMYLLQGNFKTAEEYFQKLIQSDFLVSRPKDYVNIQSNRTYILINEGKTNEAVKLLETLFEYIDTGNELNDIATYVDLIVMTIFAYAQNRDLEKLSYYLRILEDTIANEDLDVNKYLHLSYQLSKGIYYYSLGRLNKKTEAQKIFTQIIQSEIILHEYTIIAIKHLLLILLDEYKIFQSQKIADEIANLISEMLETGKKQSGIKNITDALILQSRFERLKGDLTNSYETLQELEQTIKIDNFVYLKEKIEIEKRLIEKEINEMKKTHDALASKINEISLIELDDYIRNIMGLKKMNE